MAGATELRVARLVKSLGKASVIVLAACVTLSISPSGPGTRDDGRVITLSDIGEAPYAVKFEKGVGRLIVVPPSARQNVVQFIIEARRLEEREYLLYLHREDGGGGVNFGQEALHVIYGARKTDTNVIPAGGLIHVWCFAPMRMLAGKSARVVLRPLDGGGEIAAQSAIFRGPEPRGDIDR